jgi:hypothetical protein
MLAEAAGVPSLPAKDQTGFLRQNRVSALFNRRVNGKPLRRHPVTPPHRQSIL